VEVEGAGQLQVQAAVLVRVVLAAGGVHPAQDPEAAPLEGLPRRRVVGVEADGAALEAGAQTELQLEAWGPQ
jgi:hypothetical protein